jgi:hypothetical protein
MARTRTYFGNYSKLFLSSLELSEAVDSCLGLAVTVLLLLP